MTMTIMSCTFSNIFSNDDSIMRAAFSAFLYLCNRSLDRVRKSWESHSRRGRRAAFKVKAAAAGAAAAAAMAASSAATASSPSRQAACYVLYLAYYVITLSHNIHVYMHIYIYIYISQQV